MNLDLSIMDENYEKYLNKYIELDNNTEYYSNSPQKTVTYFKKSIKYHKKMINSLKRLKKFYSKKGNSKKANYCSSKVEFLKNSKAEFKKALKHYMELYKQLI